MTDQCCPMDTEPVGCTCPDGCDCMCLACACDAWGDGDESLDSGREDWL